MLNNFNPEKLTEIREIRGYTQSSLAEEIMKSRNAISLYEKGGCNPEINTLHQLSSVLQIPIEYFYKQTNAEFKEETPTFFRKSISANKTHRLMAKGRIKWLAEIYSSISKSLKFPPVNITRIEEKNFRDYKPQEIEKIADDTRKHFGLKFGPIGNLINILEYHGVIVGKFKIANTLDAFSLWLKIGEESRPFILLDRTKDSSSRLRFNCAHELGHLILHNSITDDDIDNKESLKIIEKQAHLFASSFLLPRETFGKIVKYNGSIGELLKLKKEWGVSIQAMIERSFQIGYINEHRRKYLYKRINQLGYSKRDPADDYLKMENPSLSSEGLKILLKNKTITFKSFYEELFIPIADIAELTGISEEYLHEYYQTFFSEDESNLVNFSLFKDLKETQK
ncbi:MAG: ImmA/IrrE family metallo-endopeptidase [bacterium]|nr:ImmA/IrrE family metallo-endopeptidase [bacterium]